MNKRKVLSILLLALITVTLAVSCSGSIDAPAQDAEELAYVTFGNGHSRGLSTSYETEPYNLLYWFYTARKTDSYGTTGETTDLTPVSKVGDNHIQGLSGQVGPFSQGAWKFKLYAYGYTKTGDSTTATYIIDRNKLVYESDEVSVTLKGNEVKNVPISVSTQGSNGYVKFKNAFFKWDGNSGDSTPTMEIKLTPATGSAITNTITLNNKGTDGKLTITDDTKVVYSDSVDTIPADFYTANVIVYLKDDDLAIDNKGTPIFSQEFGLRVYGNATTYISGDMVEGVTSEVTFDVADKEMVVFSPNDEGAASFNVAVSPKGATTGSGTDTNTTKVEFPAGALAGAEHQLDVAVTPIASAEQNFQISGEDNNETAVAGIDLKMVKVEEQSGSLTQTPVKTFNGKSVTVTTYIAPGLSNVSVRYIGSENEGSNIQTEYTIGTSEAFESGSVDGYYDSSSGKLVFKTKHFSQYVVVASVEALNVSTGVPYATLASAIEGAGDGQEVKIMNDVILSATVVVDSDNEVVLDLNGHKIATVTKTNDPTRHYYAIDNYGKITIEDSSADQKGTIDARGIENLGNGIMIINSGNFKSIDSNGGACVCNEAHLIINGGKFSTTHVGDPSDNVGVGCLNNSGSALITGGEFSDVNKRTYAIISTGEIEIIPGEGKTVTVEGAHGALAIDSGTGAVYGGDYSSTDYYGLYVSNDGRGVEPKKAAVTVYGGTFDGPNYSVWIGSDYNNPVNSTIEILGGTFTKPLNAQQCTRKGAIQVKGGTFSSDPRAYVADGCTIAQNDNSKYVVTKHALWIDYADTTWYNETADSFNISSARELAGLAKLVNSGKTFSGKTVIITADIDLAGKSWTPIGQNADSANKFQGTLDGSYSENGVTISHVIRNMTVSQGASYHAAGFFGALNGTAQNLVFDNASVKSISGTETAEGGTDNGNAIVAGSIYNSGLIKNVTVTNSEVSANRYVGGIAGYVYGNIENCTVKDTVITGTPDNQWNKYDNGDKIGGIVGYLGEGSNYVKNCFASSNTITGYRDIGGLVGYSHGIVSDNTISGGTITVDNSHNYKNYTVASAHDANPIVGEASGSANVTNNSGDSSVTITLPSYPQL